MENAARNRRRIVKALHIHINASTPGGFARAASLLQAFVSETVTVALPAAAGPAPPPPPPVQRPYCSICRSYMADIRLPCNHTFCESCVRPWILRHHTCADAFCTRPTTLLDISPVPNNA